MQSNYSQLHALLKRGSFLAIATVYYLRYPACFERIRHLIEDPLQAHLSTINIMANAIGKAKNFVDWKNIESYFKVSAQDGARDYLRLLPRSYQTPSINDLHIQYWQCMYGNIAIDHEKLRFAIHGYHDTLMGYFSESDKFLASRLMEEFDSNSISNVKETLIGIFSDGAMINHNYINSYLAFFSDSAAKSPDRFSTLCKEVYLQGLQHSQYSIDLSACQIEKYNYPHLAYPFFCRVLLDQWPLLLIHYRRKFPYTVKK